MPENQIPTHGEPFNEVVEVTPSLAGDWLNRSDGNRSINWEYVAQLARDVKIGRFQCTHQGIAFDIEGRLIDGQHRLWAIVDADVPARLRVFYNEAPENIVNIDANRPRQAAQRITMQGVMGTVRNDELATLRTMLAGIGLVFRRRTIHEEMSYLKVYRHPLHFALTALPRSAQTAGVATALSWAVIARAWHSAPVETLIRFGEVLRTGVGGYEEEQPILLLWKALAGTRTRGGTREARQRRYGLIQRALAAYLDNERLSVLRPATAELFLLPGEHLINDAG